MTRLAVIEGEPKSIFRFRGHFLRAVRDAGHEPHVFGPADEAARAWLAAERIPFHEIAVSRGTLSPGRDARLAFSLFRELRRLRPGLIMTCTIKPAVYGIPAAALAGVPRRFALITGLGYAFTSGARMNRRIAGAAAHLLYRTSLRRATAAIFQNTDDREEFHQRGLLGRTPSHVVNGSGVELDRFAPVPLPAAPRFLMIARLLRDKGIGEYLAAARIVKAARPAAQFDLVGPTDPNPSALPLAEVRAAADAGIVTYHGEVTDVRGLIAAARIYVLPSYREGTSRAVLEAMAMGRPVITTDAPGCRAVVGHGENGLLVPVRSVEPLAAAMIGLIDDPEAARRMGARSRTIAEQRYDAELVTGELMRILGL